MIVLFPDGTEVQATAGGRPENDPEPLFELYLDRCWEEFRPTWEHVILDWPDFGVPADLDGATIQIRSAFARAQGGERVEVGCLGGLGRTGTLLECMAILSGVAPKSAVEWTRKTRIENAHPMCQCQPWLAPTTTGRREPPGPEPPDRRQFSAAAADP